MPFCLVLIARRVLLRRSRDEIMRKEETFLQRRGDGKVKRVAFGWRLPGPDRARESPTAVPLLTPTAVGDASTARGAADADGSAARPPLLLAGAPFLPHGTQRDKGCDTASSRVLWRHVTTAAVTGMGQAGSLLVSRRGKHSVRRRLRCPPARRPSSPRPAAR